MCVSCPQMWNRTSVTSTDMFALLEWLTSWFDICVADLRNTTLGAPSSPTSLASFLPRCHHFSLPPSPHPAFLAFWGHVIYEEFALSLYERASIITWPVTVHSQHHSSSAGVSLCEDVCLLGFCFQSAHTCFITGWYDRCESVDTHKYRGLNCLQPHQESFIAVRLKNSLLIMHLCLFFLLFASFFFV